MAAIVQRPAVEVSATMEFSEVELRALDALVGYGFDGFIKVFYEKMGKHYMQPHEAGMRSVFKSISSSVPDILSRADDARSVFTGERIAVRKPTPKPAQAIGEDAGIAAILAKSKGQANG